MSLNTKGVTQKLRQSIKASDCVPHPSSYLESDVNHNSGGQRKKGSHCLSGLAGSKRSRHSILQSMLNMLRVCSCSFIRLQLSEPDPDVPVRPAP